MNNLYVYFTTGQVFVVRPLSSDMDLTVYNSMLMKVQHNPKYMKEYFPSSAGNGATSGMVTGWTRGTEKTEKGRRVVPNLKLKHSITYIVCTHSRHCGKNMTCINAFLLIKKLDLSWFLMSFFECISNFYHSKNNTAVACRGRRWCWSFVPLLIVIRAVVVYDLIRFVIHTSWCGMTKLCTPQQGYTFTIAVTANARLCMENDASFGSMTMCHHSRVK